MHEVAIIDGLLGIIDNCHKKENFRKVIEIEIVCGKYNCASQEALEFCFQVADKKPYLKDTRLVLHRLPEKYSCGSCNKDIIVENTNLEDLVCPFCGSSRIKAGLNMEIYLGKLEVE